MKNSQKGFAHLFILIAILILIGGGIYFYSKRVNDSVGVDSNSSIFGSYEKEFATIVVTEVGEGRLRIEGNAVWEGADAMSGQVNSGTLSGEVALDGDNAVYRDGDCEIQLNFGQDMLYVKDNNKCGGLNVSFAGTYKKVDVLAAAKAVENGQKTYVHDVYGFEFQYPHNFQVNQQFTNGNTVQLSDNNGTTVIFDIGQVKNTQGKAVTIEGYLKEYGYDKNYQKEEKRINGNSWLRFDGGNSLRYILVRGDTKYELVINSTNANSASAADMIVNTFRFTK